MLDLRTGLAQLGPRQASCRSSLAPVVAAVGFGPGTVGYRRYPAAPGNEVREGAEEGASETSPAAYRRVSSQLARAWALRAASGELEDVRREVRFYEEVRVWMAKLDAEVRQSPRRRPSGRRERINRDGRRPRRLESGCRTGSVAGTPRPVECLTDVVGVPTDNTVTYLAEADPPARSTTRIRST